MTAATRVKAILLLGLALVAFVGSDSWFAILGDESEFVTLAHQPLAQTFDDYVYGDGQPEHAPLAGVVLHAWLPIGGHAQWSLRIPSMLFYLAGIVGFALAARRLGGDRAFLSLLWIGVLWPLGFHFGRLADWYSLCFFLVAATTLAYLIYLERRDTRQFAVFLIVAVLLVYATYYGWVIVGCLLIDLLLIRRDRDSLKFVAITLATLALAYLPIWRVFAGQVLSALSAEGFGSPALIKRSLIALYNLYALFVSQSVAPWIWYVSIPVSAAIAASVGLMLSLLPKCHRRYLIYFAVLFGVMVILNIINTHRLLHISGWLLLSFALALANSDKPIQRRLLACMLAFIGVVGWGGILARDYYAAPQIVEPWTKIADDAANIVRSGGVVVSNSTSFMFDMNYALFRIGLVEASSVPGWVNHPAINWDDEQSAVDLAGKSSILFVKEGQFGLGVHAGSAERWLTTNCMAGTIRNLMPDAGHLFKAKYIRNLGPQPYRIALREYDCSGGTRR